MNYRKLTPKIRERLKEPQGDLIKGEIPLPYKEASERIDNDSLIITVGDITSENALDVGIDVDLLILDYKTKREPYDTDLPNSDMQMRVKNPAGYISDDMINKIKKAIDLIEVDGQRIRLRVDGEEDLAVIPSAIHAPYGSLILYGQPDEGLVVVEVDDSCKDFVNDVFNSMKEVDEDGIENQ